jgi:hypothetical protein
LRREKRTGDGAGFATLDRVGSLGGSPSGSRSESAAGAGFDEEGTFDMAASMIAGDATVKASKSRAMDRPKA